jgi:hypothetical protein
MRYTYFYFILCLYRSRFKQSLLKKRTFLKLRHNKFDLLRLLIYLKEILER